MDLNDIQDGEVYAVEESKYDGGETARVEHGRDGSLIAHVRVPAGCRPGDAIPIVIVVPGDPSGAPQHVADYPCPEGKAPGDALEIMLGGPGEGRPPPPPPEKDVIFVTVPEGCREGDAIPILHDGVDTGLSVKCPAGKRPGDVMGVKCTEEDLKQSKGRMEATQIRLDALQDICRKLPVCVDFGGKDVADLLADEAYYQEAAERTAAHAEQANQQRKRFEDALAAARKGVKEDKDDQKKKDKRIKKAKERADTKKKLEIKLAKAKRDGNAKEVAKCARLVEALKEKVIEEKVARVDDTGRDLMRRSDWEDQAQLRLSAEKRLEKYRRSVSTAIEKEAKEKAQRKADECVAWLAKHDEQQATYKFKEESIVQARYRGRERFVPALVKAARKDGTYDLEFTDVDDEDAKTLDVAQAETLAARSKHAHETKHSLAYKTQEKAKKAADEITKLVNKLYRRRALTLHPDRCGGGEEARAKFDAFQIASAVLKDQEKRLLYVSEMTKSKDIAQEKGVDQDLEEAARYQKWHDSWLKRHKASLGLEGDAEKVTQKPMRLEAEEALRPPTKVRLVATEPVGPSLKVVGEVSAKADLAAQFVSVECRAELAWGYGGLDKEPITKSVTLEPLASGRHAAKVTFDALTFGGWELKWRVAVERNGTQTWSPWSTGASVDVIDPRADEQDAKRKKAAEKCANEAARLESLLRDAQTWSTLNQDALQPNVDRLERLITRCAQLCRLAPKDAAVPCRRVVDRAAELHAALEDRITKREQRSERRAFAQAVRRRVWAGGFGDWIAGVTKANLAKEHGDVNRLFQALVATERKALVAANWASDDVLDGAAARADLFSKKNVEALTKCAQQARDKRRSEEDKERQKAAKARASKKAAAPVEDDDDFDDAAWARFVDSTVPAPVAPPPPPAPPPTRGEAFATMHSLGNADKDLECPITYELFVDPVTLEGDGKVYERDAIAQWLRRGHMTSPATGLPLAANQTRLIPNERVRLLAEAARSQPEPPSPCNAPVPLRVTTSRIQQPQYSRPAVVSPPTPMNGPGPLKPCLADFVAALGLAADAKATLVQQLVAAEVLDLETATYLEANDWRDAGLKVGTRKKVLARLEAMA